MGKRCANERRKKSSDLTVHRLNKVKQKHPTPAKSEALLLAVCGSLCLFLLILSHLSEPCRTPATRRTSACGTSCNQSSPACLWRVQRRGSPASSTLTTPTCWRAQWMSTTVRGTATWLRSGDCWTLRATVSACRWVSGERSVENQRRLESDGWGNRETCGKVLNCLMDASCRDRSQCNGEEQGGKEAQCKMKSTEDRADGFT